MNKLLKFLSTRVFIEMSIVQKLFKFVRMFDFSKPLAYADLVKGNSNNVLLSDIALDYLLREEEFNTVIDVGSGAGKHADIFEKNGKSVSRFDFGKSRAFCDVSDQIIIGDFLNYDFQKKFDLVWASHVLEHSIHTQEFLEKTIEVCKPNEGIIALTVPPAKPEFVGGHVTLWTPALLIYRLVLAGLDCSNAIVLCYGYNISVIVKNRKNDLDIESLAWDLHDVERIACWLPKGLTNGVDGSKFGTVFRGANRFFL